MAGPIAIDTPDYQRGVVSAQKLLATVAAGTQSVVVGLPPNTETLVVTMARNTVAYDARCTGVQSGLGYPGVLALNTLDNIGSSTWFFDVSDVIDSEVNVSFVGEATSAWWVYADAGVHIVADASKATNQLGQQYVVPIAPSGLTLDHPPVELQLASILDAANGTALVAAPGGGKRIRVFDAFVNATSTGTFVALRTSVTAKQIIGLSTNTANTAGRISGYPSGIPMPADEGVNLVVTAGNVDGTVTYTVETI